jgi:hypothetical protein
MPCPKCSETLKRCPDVKSSDCMKYVGEDSVCDIFCKGQSVSEVIEAIDVETCTLKTNTDVSQIDIRDFCEEVKNEYISKGYDEQNVSNFIEFLISYDCVLQGQINNINNTLTNFQSIVTGINWGCLGIPCSPPSSIPTSEAIQKLIDAHCSQQIEIENLKTTNCQQQKTIDALIKSIELCLIPKLNVIGDTLTPKITFGSCQVIVNPNPPC